MPAITFLFFIIIALIIFIMIVPTFAVMLTSTGKTIAPLTHSMIMISEFIRSWRPVAVMAVVIVTGLLIRYYSMATKRIKHGIDTCVLALPCIGNLIKKSVFAYYFQSLALLTKTGVHLVTALAIANQSLSHTVLYQAFEELLADVEQGNSLSVALARQPKLFSEHSVALISVGQESGCLPFVFGQIAALYKDQINRLLATIATLLQPLLMIILGLLIGLLVFSLYAPLFNLSEVIC